MYGVRRDATAEQQIDACDNMGAAHRKGALIAGIGGTAALAFMRLAGMPVALNNASFVAGEVVLVGVVVPLHEGLRGVFNTIAMYIRNPGQAETGQQG